MNYLALCQRFYRESGESFVKPDTVEGVSGYDALVVGWINQSWLAIQKDRRARGRWKWAWREWAMDIGPDARDYDKPWFTRHQTPGGIWGQSRFGEFVWGDPGQSATVAIEVIAPESLTIEPKDAPGQAQPLVPQTWFDMRRGSRVAASGRPRRFAELDNGKIRFDCVPDRIYTVRGEGWLGPWSLLRNTDEPDMPERFHMLIVYQALLDYGRWESAGEQYRAAEVAAARLWAELLQQQTSKVMLRRRPLA